MQKTTKYSVTIDSLLRRQTSMKKYLLLLTASLSLTVGRGQTSVYHPFPDSNAIWNISFGLYCFQNGTASEEYSITISGDTIINSQTYHKLTTPYVLSYSTGTCGGLQPGYKGAIRQETANRKVFFVPPSNSTEQLLYDFNMQVGDTVKGYIESWKITPDIVQSIDSVLVGNNYRKRWSINPNYMVDFIEGIGSTYGLIERSPSYMDDANYFITCFRQNGQTLFPDTNAICETIVTSVYSVDNHSIAVNISPNPFSIQTTLQTAERLQNASLTVYNSVGQTVKRIDNLAGQTIVFHRDNLPSGLYFVRLTQDSNTISADKFVITDK